MNTEAALAALRQHIELGCDLSAPSVESALWRFIHDMIVEAQEATDIHEAARNFLNAWDRAWMNTVAPAHPKYFDGHISALRVALKVRKD